MTDLGASQSDRATTPSGPSPAVSGEAGIPRAGDWVIIRDWGVIHRQIERVTPKLLKLAGRWPRQVPHDDKRIICFAPDEAIAERLVSSIAGADGEYDRRRKLAKLQFDEAKASARAARDKAFARLIAQGIAAGTGETRDAARPGGQKPGPKAAPETEDQ